MSRTKFYRLGVLFFSVVTSLLLMDISGKAYAADSGTLGCLGKYNDAGDNSVETIGTRYRLANFNDIRTIVITRIRIFNGNTGAVLYDSGASGFPTTFNPTLGPYQATHLRIEDVIALQTSRQLPTIIEWESEGKGRVNPLNGWAEHRTREISTSLEKSRHNYMCSAL